MAKTLDEAGVKRLIQEIKGANKNLNAPIPISTENTTESKAQNVTNIADYVEKAKAAGIASVNGMAVTCIIDNDYSGVGYLYGDTTICGIKTNDALEAPSFFDVESGSYHENEVLVKGLSDQITSDMLVEGARKPIILTPSTTEVDEETYQKLLSDDVDVVFKTDSSNICTFTWKYEGDTSWDFYFTCFSCEANDLEGTFLYGLSVNIQKSAPHKVTIVSLAEDSLSTILAGGGFINKSTLSPVLQEIDLTGTDADRKAKLDKFETDWKALTGASDLTGARFVGLYRGRDTNQRTALFIHRFSQDPSIATYEGISMNSDDGYDDISKNMNEKVSVNDYNGSLTITPLFSHLESITIKTGNTPDDKAANVAAIKAYVDNLKALGVDVTKGYMIPCKFDNSRNGFIMQEVAGNYAGFIKDAGTYYGGGFVSVTTDGTYKPLEILSTAGYNFLTTNSKYILNAINEVNALAKGNTKSLEAITIRTGNTPDDKAANVAAIKAYVDNLTALGVDVTKGYIIPITDGTYQGILMSLDGRNKRYRGQLYKDDEHYCPLYIEEDGAIHVSDIFISYTSNLSTTSTQIVGAINEVNALAKGYSTIFTPIELTTETAQNKTAIDARVAEFTAQGISLTNGCCIPVTYKGVYAGNISLINGDWYGLLVKNTNNPADNINIKLSADGTITEGNSAQ